MNLEDIKEKVDQAINKFMEKDEYLLNSDVNERSMTHKLAEKIQDKFENYYVDCEYNKNCGTSNDTKRIGFLENEIKKIDHLKDKTITDKEFYEVSVYPDIIVHKRGCSEYNLLITEVKKSNRQISEQNYDIHKVKKYTSDKFNDGLDYEFGAFMVFDLDKTTSDISWYENGEKIINRTIEIL